MAIKARALAIQDQAVILYEEGDTIRGIAKKLKCAPYHVRGALIHAGVRIRHQGEKVDSRDRYRQTLSLLQQGATQSQIAEFLGISRQRVYQMLMRSGYEGPARVEMTVNRLCPVCGKRFLINAESDRDICSRRCSTERTYTRKYWESNSSALGLRVEMLYRYGLGINKIAVILGIPPGSRVHRIVKESGLCNWRKDDAERSVSPGHVQRRSEALYEWAHKDSRRTRNGGASTAAF